MRPGAHPLLIGDSDNPPDWLAWNLSIDDIVSIRARTIRGRSPLAAFAGPLQEIALSARPVEVDVTFEKPVSFHLAFDGTVAPVGLTGPVRRMDIVGNACTERAVDMVVSDTDLSAGSACTVLREAEIYVYRIANLMTPGLLGRRRRFVPTRWAITAVDDTISIRLKHEIAKNPPVDEITVHGGEIFGNRIACILVPGDWRFEMVEIWGAKTLWAGDDPVVVTDREWLKKSGYSPISGAYYSARLAVCEYLAGIRRCARVVLIRSVNNEYWAPLGTSFVREAVRKAMAEKAAPAATLEGVVQQASALLGSHLWEPYSTLIPELSTQRTLSQF